MKKKKESGFIALTSVLIIGAVTVILGVSIFYASLTDQAISTAYQNSQEAAFLADFCLKEGVLRLKEDIDYVGGEEIEVDDMVCYIGLVEDINGDSNSKKVSSLGKAGDQPHFSRSSQLIRYVIESGASDWVSVENEEDLVNLWVVGDSLRLKSSKKVEVTQTTDSSDDWGDGALVSVEVTEGGSLVLAAITPGEYGELCSSRYECQSGFCVDGVCCDGACSGSTCQTCGQYTSHPNGIGHCGYVNDSVQDPRDECYQGSSAMTGCRSASCSGTGYTCGVQISGDGGCPVCGRCTDSDIACESYSYMTYDATGPETCFSCKACGWSSGGLLADCDKTRTTDWNAGGSYGCLGSDNRCLSGNCIECEGQMNAGYCWYSGNYRQTCTSVCEPHEGVYKNTCDWTNDPSNCSTCKLWYPTALCRGSSSTGPDLSFGRCSYHRDGYSYCDTARYYRQCACDH